jgi:hypothetical protein
MESAEMLLELALSLASRPLLARSNMLFEPFDANPSLPASTSSSGCTATGEEPMPGERQLVSAFRHVRQRIVPRRPVELLPPLLRRTP